MSTPLRRQFETCMTLRRFAPKTKEAYIRSVKGLAEYYHLSPDKLTNEQVQAYLKYLIEERNLAWSSVNVAFSGLCFFLGIVSRRKI